MFSNLGSRILVSAALIVVVTFFISIINFDFNQETEIQASLKSNVIKTGDLTTVGITNWIGERQLLIENVGHNIITNPAPDRVNSFVDRKVLNDTFMFTYFGSKDGVMTMYPNEPLPEGYDPRVRPWYKKAVAARSSTLAEPYMDASTGNLIVTITTPVIDGNDVLGVVGGDIEINALADYIKSVDLGGIGYAFLVNDQGTILVHPDSQWTLRSIAAAYPDETPSINTDIGNFAEGSSQKMFAFFKVEGLPTVNWYLGLAIDRKAAFEAGIPEQ